MLKNNPTEFEHLDTLVDDLLICASWGDENVAFVKMDYMEDKQIWVIYSADGVKLASTENRDLAYVMARQNEYDVMSAH